MTYLLLIALIFVAPVGYLHAQDLFFKGKTIRIIIGYPSGSGSDAEGRLLARYLGNYLPGNPSVIVQNMPGGGGMVASNWFEELAKPDGLTLYYCVGATAVMRQALAMEEVKYNIRGWPVLGSFDRGTPVVLIKPEKLDRLTNRDKPPLGIGARTSEDTGVSSMFLWGAEFLNWNVRWILGYQGGGELRLAFERGEIDLFGTTSLQTLRDLTGAGYKTFTQQGRLTGAGSFKRRPEYPDVPTFDELLGNRRPPGDAWQAYVTWNGSDASGRPLFAPRNTPRQIVQILRDSFDKLEADKQFVSDLKKVAGDDADLRPAKEAEPILRQLLSDSPGVRDFIKAIMKKHIHG
jgi:tripartite-type tricarboxylate transporter receptor subunit TctC